MIWIGVTALSSYIISFFFCFFFFFNFTWNLCNCGSQFSQGIRTKICSYTCIQACIKVWWIVRIEPNKRYGNIGQNEIQLIWIIEYAHYKQICAICCMRVSVYVLICDEKNRQGHIMLPTNLWYWEWKLIIFSAIYLPNQIPCGYWKYAKLWNKSQKKRWTRKFRTQSYMGKSMYFVALQFRLTASSILLLYNLSSKFYHWFKKWLRLLSLMRSMLC